MKNFDTASQTLPRRSRLWMVLLLGALSAFGPLSIDMYLPSLPSLARDLHTTASLAQLSLTACLLGLALGQLFVGPLSDVRGRRSPLIAGLVFYAASSLACAAVPSIWALIGLRFIQGAAGAAGIVISRAIVRDLYSGTELTKFFSLLMLVNGVAPILAPIVGGQLLRITSWHGVFIVLFVIGIIMLLAVTFALPETLPNQDRAAGNIKDTLFTFGKLFKDRVFMGYALSQGLVLAAMFGYISGSPFVLQQIFGLSPQAFSICFAANGLGIILATQTAGRLAGRISETKLLISGLVLAGVSGLVLLTAVSTGAGLFAVLPPLFFTVASVGIVTTTGFSLAMQNQSRSAGSASALLGLLPFIFGAVTAPLVGIAGSSTAIPMGIVIAVCEIGAVACYVTLARQRPIAS